MQEKYKDEVGCSKTKSRLSNYVDNTLSAREMWEVEKHLAACRECARLAQLTHATVDMLRSGEVLDTGNDFMSRLHARLDDLGPVPAHRSALDVVREWIISAREQLNVRPVPTLSIGMASLLVAAVLISVRSPVHSIAPAQGLPEVVSQEALDRHVAVIASDPFDDPVAAKLEAETKIVDSAGRSTTE